MTSEPGSSTTGGRLPDPELVVAKEKAKQETPTQRALHDARNSASRNKDAVLSAGALGLGAIAVAAATFGAVRAKKGQQVSGKTAPSGGKTRVGDRTTDDAPAYTARSNPSDFAVAGRSVLINRPRSELYTYFRDFQNLPTFMENLKAVRPEGGKVSTWVVKAPAGKTVEVKTKVVAEKKGELIAWASTPDSTIESRGRIEFRDAPGNRGTYVTLVIAYDPPGGMLGKWAAKLFRREPEVQARVELKRFKMLMETGEIATSDNRPTAG